MEDRLNEDPHLSYQEVFAYEEGENGYPCYSNYYKCFLLIPIKLVPTKKKQRDVGEWLQERSASIEKTNYQDKHLSIEFLTKNFQLISCLSKRCATRKLKEDMVSSHNRKMFAEAHKRLDRQDNIGISFTEVDIFREFLKEADAYARSESQGWFYSNEELTSGELNKMIDQNIDFDTF